MTIVRLEPGLIVNADDFGVHPGINAGILSAYRNGLVSSLSLMVTMPRLDESCRDLLASGAPAGLHLSLTQGRAVSAPGKVPDLVDDAGNFRHSAQRLLMLGWRSGEGSRFLRQIRDEFAAQFALARDHGIALTHADSHQHIHMNAAVFSLVEELAPRFGVGRVRWTSEPVWPMLMMAGFGQATRRKNQLKWLVLRWTARGISPRLPTTDSFFGIIHSGIISKRVLARVLQRISPAQSIEICIHPGFPPSSAEGAAGNVAAPDRFTTSPFRQIEHDALVAPDVADIIRRRGLRLMSFTGVSKDGN